MIADAVALQRVVEASSVGWNADTAANAGWVGVVRTVDASDNTLRVQFGSKFWWLPSTVLRPTDLPPTASSFAVGGMVRLVADAGELQRLVEASSVGWNEDMANFAGETGTVLVVDTSDDTVRVQMRGTTDWWLPLSVLQPGTTAFATGDSVRCIDDAAELQRLVEASYVGWNAEMAASTGATGTITRVDNSDDTIQVDFGNNTSWWLIPGVLRPAAATSATSATSASSSSSSSSPLAMSTLSVGDSVRLLRDSAELQRLVEASDVGWNTNMAAFAGSTGTVNRFDASDNTVELRIGSHTWWFPLNVLVRA